MMDNNIEDVKFDLMELLNHTFDAKVNNDLLSAAENMGEDIAYNFIKLLNEYGIYGLKVHEFMAKLQMILSLHEEFGGGEDEMP